jgi:hypothetical protein
MYRLYSACLAKGLIRVVCEYGEDFKIIFMQGIFDQPSRVNFQKNVLHAHHADLILLRVM